MRSRVAHVIGTAVTMLFLAGAATPASADWLFTPYLGVTFGGAADFGDVGDFEDNLEKKITFGGTATWMGAGIIGFEVDFGSTPNFFQVTSGEGDFEFFDSNVTTLMGNLIIGAPIGGQSGVGVRPYGSVGVGLMRTNASFGGFIDDIDSNELGLNLGGGAHVFFNDNVGVRGDLRYFRGLQDDDENDLDLDLADFDFWRATVGVTFRFGQ
jgi:opacity protein-like surface antigen